MKKIFTDKYNELQDEVISHLRKLIEKSDTESKFSNQNILEVKDDQQFNLDDNNYLREVAWHNLIDNHGNNYSFYVLTLEQLCELADSFN